MKHLKVALVALSFAAAGAAYAQQGPGGGPPSPEMTAMRAACQADAEKLCAGKQGREQGQCLRDNEAKLSKPCADARAKLAAARAAGGGGQRPPAN
jgi:hypothetical protein